MQAISVREAKQQLEELIKRVNTDAEATIVVGDQGDQAVLVPIDEYNAWKETLYLLANPANADRLRTSIAEARAGHVAEQKLIDA